MGELVALYDQHGPTGKAADRAEVRARNLRHGATAVVVRNSAGQIYVHRRTGTKDVYPGRYDFAAGGVLQAGEDPYAAAVREAEEELGVHGVPLDSLGEGDYADDQTDYHAHCFTCVYDGPVAWQPEEVSWGGWATPARVRAMIDEVAFVPDTVALLGRWLAAQ